MVKMTKYFFSLVLFTLIALTLSSQPKDLEKKISDINVLLPTCDSADCNKVYYTVSAQGGCYEWSVDKPGYIDLNQVQGKDDKEGCFHKVTISVTNNNKSRSEIVWLIAKDKKSNEQFKCKVGFGKIKKLQIAKKFEKMNLGEITDINVNAFDEMGNMFSSVKGFRFHWKITDGNIVQLLKLSQEKVKVGEVRIEVEKKAHSDIILLKGINTGKVVLTAEILEKDYDSIKSDPRKLYVIEPFRMYPDDPVYILPNNTFTFDLELIQFNPNESERKFVLPSNRNLYKWSVNNSNCGKIKGFGEFSTLDKICTTQIEAVDSRIDNFNTVSNQVNVVLPTSMDISIIEVSKAEGDKIFNDKLYDNEKLKNYNDFELKNKNDYDNSNTWKLVSGRSYLVKNFLMHEQHFIRYSLNTIKFNFDLAELTPYIEQIKCIHGNEVCLMTMKTTSTDYLTLKSSVNAGNGIDKSYSIIKNVKIFPQLTIKKFGLKGFTLPYLGFDSSFNSTQLKSQELRLKVNGGTGNYLFESFNSDVIQVKDEILYGKATGKTVVKVTDADIKSNFDFINVEIAEIKDLDYLEERQEVVLGNEFYVTPMALKVHSLENESNKLSFYYNNVFTNCTNLKLNSSLSVKDKNIKQIQEDSTELNFSNFESTNKFLNENQDLLKLKIKSPLTADDQEYLDYINYGICDSRGFKSNNEGYLRLSFFSQIQNKKTGVSSKIMSSNTAKIFVYSTITLSSPKFDDIFTQELLSKAHIDDFYRNKNFLLAIGSGVTAKFAGGVVPWVEKSNEFTENAYFSEPSKNRTYPITEKDGIKFVKISNKEYYIECTQETNEKEIVVNIQNKEDLTLLRPAKNSISFSITCSNPKSLSLFFLDIMSITQHSSTNMIKDETGNDVFGVPQKAGIEYFEKKNGIEFVRVYAFDSNKRLYYNISSIQGHYNQKNSLSENKLFTILSENQFKQYLSSHNNDTQLENSILLNSKKQSSEFIQSVILFENEISKFDLYYDSIITGLNHYAKINLIDFPVISPNNSTVYLTEDNKIELTVENGSGDFDLSLSDDSLAKLEYSAVERKIFVTPLKQGILSIYLKDNKINNGFKATGTVYISTIKDIKLIGGGLVMVNNTMPVNMKVYDFYNHVFTESQIKKMILEIGDFKHISNGLKFTFNESNDFPTLGFTLRGIIPDVYSVFVKDLKSNITSNNLRVEVFDKIVVFPPSLLMVPGSSYTLSVRGGPVNELHVNRKYQMVNSEVATVGETEPEVKAHLQGKTKLRIILTLNPDYNKFYMVKDDYSDAKDELGNVLAIEEVDVKVDFPDSVSIRGAVNRKVYTKSTARLFAALKLGEETFTYGTGPFKFEWDIDNTLIAKLRYYKPLKEECRGLSNKSDQCNLMVERNKAGDYKHVDPLNSLGVFLTTTAQGIVGLKLTVSVTYPSPYGWRKPNYFVKNEKILIQDEIYVDIPEFYENIPNKSSLYLIPINVDHELHTNKNNNNVKYSVISQHGTESNLKENIISISDSGKITTYQQTGIAHVLINQKDKENPAFIPVVLPIYVTDFYSLFAEKSYGLIDMEVGQEATLKIMVQHEYGLLFADGKFERFELRTVESNPKIARAELIEKNSKIKIKGNSKGETNIIIFHPVTMQVLDVFQVNVYTSIVLPEKVYVNIGGTVDFLKNDEKRKNYLTNDAEWISDNENVFQIDQFGQGTGLKEGTTNIHLVSRDRRKVKLSTTIYVVRVKKAEIDRTSLPQYLTDIKTSNFYRSEYKIPVKFFINDDEIALNQSDDLNEINQNVNFKCTSNTPELFTAETYFDSEVNKGCIVKIRESGFSSTPKSNLELIISVESKGERSTDQYSYKTKFKLPFTSSFKIKNNLKELTFGKNNRTQYIYADNLHDVNVEVSDKSLFKIEVAAKEDENYIRLYVPHNITYNFKDVKLNLSNKNTGQNEEILLNYIYNEEVYSEKIFFGLIKRDTLIDFLTLVVLVITIYILYNYLKGEDQNVRVQPPIYSANKPPMGRVSQSAVKMTQ